MTSFAAVDKPTETAVADLLATLMDNLGDAALIASTRANTMKIAANGNLLSGDVTDAGSDAQFVLDSAHIVLNAMEQVRSIQQQVLDLIGDMNERGK